MPDKITYYAIVDDLSSREQPAGVLRRIYFETGGRHDEAFSQHLAWERTAMLVSAERGDLQNEFIEITEDEANQIVERIRAEVTGASNT
jgi:hypothetical protein